MGKQNEITRICLQKCVSDYNNPSLSTGQKVCLSRCVFKFIDTLNFGNEALNYYVNDINSQQHLG